MQFDVTLEMTLCVIALEYGSSLFSTVISQRKCTGSHTEVMKGKLMFTESYERCFLIKMGDITFCFLVSDFSRNIREIFKY